MSLSILNRLCSLVVVVRIVLAVSTIDRDLLYPALVVRPELSSTTTSYRRLLDGVFLWKSKINPYDGGCFHQSPLLLFLFSHVPSAFVPFVYLALDLLAASLLASLATSRPESESYAPAPPLPKQSSSSDPSEHDSDSLSDPDPDAPNANTRDNTIPDPPTPSPTPSLLFATYLLNPYTHLSSLSRSTAAFANVLVLLALVSASRRNALGATVWISLATVVAVYPVALVGALGILSGSKGLRGVLWFVIGVGVWVGGWIAGMGWVLGSWDFLDATFGVTLSARDLTVNVGLYWYFFIEIFDQFRTFFTWVFQLLAFIFAVPITMRFEHDPVFAATLLLFTTGILKSYPSVSDILVPFSLLPLFTPTLRYTHNLFFTLTCFLYATVLGPVMHGLWLYSGSGNANFYYAMTLVWGLAGTLVVVDVGYAAVRREFEIRDGKSRGWRLEVVHR